LFHEIVAVEMFAFERYKDRAGSDLPAICCNME
jgi:hypothetical protein